jgi:signal transduction histidine kinase
MTVSRFSRRVLIVIGLGVALPALLLAVIGISLTLRIGRAVEESTTRYNAYMAQQVAEAYELELLAHLRLSIALAENAARSGANEAGIRAALEAGSNEFGPAHVVSLKELTQFALRVMESEPVVYGARPDGRWFAGIMLRDQSGQLTGAGGWWFDPGVFLKQHLESVVQDRLPSNPRMYGGFETTRRLSVELLDANGTRLAAVREPYNLGDTRTARLEAPFEGYRVRVGVTSSAPVVWTERFVVLEVAFIGLMGLVILLATIFGLRYTVRQLELAQLKSGFVSNVTHELKTPIALIKLAVETLEMGRFRSPEESQKFLHSIGREADRLTQLVDNILDFARLESGRVTFRLERLDPAVMVREALETFRPRLDDQGFKVEVEIPDRLPEIRADGRALSHAVLNLLDNAVKYSRQRREVRISAGARDGVVRISVADRGLGIAAGDQKKVFDKFVRLETGLVHDVKGAGLGLALVHQIVRAHGGRVELVSTPGEGSTFTLVLPIAEGESAAPHEERALTG